MWRFCPLGIVFIILPIISHGDRVGFTPSPSVVCITDGCVRGVVVPGNFKPYTAWYGIPYAAPPVGSLRFKNPLPPTRWDHILDARTPKPSCVQSDFLTKAITGSEDCLHLNVYVPKGINTELLLPVLVFIHGGSFKGGSADPGFFGPDFIMDTQEVIVVTIQYRLNIFGFLASGDKNCQGNFGIKDQHLALQWIHKNIRKFGGSSKRITLMGQSAGAASIQYHMVNQKANGLFQKVIFSSGSALASWASVHNPLEIFRQYAAAAQIPLANSLSTKEIVKILRTKSAEDLMRYHDSIYVLHPVISVVGPVIEGNWPGAYIRDDPEYVWESCQYEQRPFLTAINGYEQGAYSNLIDDPPSRDALLASPAYILSVASEIPEAALQPIFDYYFGGTLTLENLPRALQFLADSTIAYPGYRTIKQYTQCGNVYKRPVDIYVFNFTSTFSLSALTNPIPINGKGASHTDDLLYLFRFAKLDQLFQRKKAENRMKDFFVKFIIDYMKKGVEYSPNGLKRCTIKDMEEGFCFYQNIQRKKNRVLVTVSNDIDTGMIQAIEDAYRIVDQIEK